jgi:calcineurin-like phosphoesterase family protein
MTSAPPAAAAAVDQRPVSIPVPQWIISDTHLGHENILTYCPWRQTWAATLAEHDAAIIAAWQAHVAPTDMVLHLGDLCLGHKERLTTLRQQLPGRIILVRGNHDRSRSAMHAAGIDEIHSAVVIQDGDRRWYGRHNPASFSRTEAASAEHLLHGHCHGNGYAPDIHRDIVAKAIDCSLDALNSIAPVPWTTMTH